jgi:uncharacterized membrane protein
MKDFAKHITLYVSHSLEILATIIIGLAILRIIFQLYLLVARQPATSHERIRIQFGTSVAVALELLLGADVLATAVAPSWNDIGQLAAIAIIRTALNHFLAKELKEYQPGMSRMDMNLKSERFDRATSGKKDYL